MRKVLRLTGIGTVALATAITITGCVNGQVPANGHSKSDGSAFAPLSSSSSSSESSASGSAKPFGKACSKMPQADTSDMPAGKAIDQNPMLRSFGDALDRSGLGDELNQPGKQYTVFAPTDSAFESAGNAGAGALRGYVLDQRQDRGALLGGKQLRTLDQNTLSVSGGDDQLTVAGPNGAKANVVCGGIKAANATIYIIDNQL